MPAKLKNKLILCVSGFGADVSAQAAIDQAKEFLSGLEKVSPWKRPFDVSGITREAGNLPLATDWSDFDAVVMAALRSYSGIKYRNPDPSDWSLSPESTSPYGFRMSFSDYPVKLNYEKSVVVSVGTQPNSAVSISVPFFYPGEVNSEWNNIDNVMNIFIYMIDFFDPQRGSVLTEEMSNHFTYFDEHGRLHNKIWRNGRSIGLINYSTDLTIVKDLKCDLEEITLPKGIIFSLCGALKQVSELTDYSCIERVLARF